MYASATYSEYVALARPLELSQRDSWHPPAANALLHSSMLSQAQMLMTSTSSDEGSCTAASFLCTHAILISTSVC
jgi:hypothetical protein